MLQGPITKISRENAVDRSKEKLPSVWVKSQAGSKPVLDLKHFGSPAAPLVQANPTSPVLIMLGEHDLAVYQTLLIQAKTGARVYVLVGQGWSKGQGDKELLACPTVLIRKIPEVPVTGLFANDRAALWIGPKGSLSLDPQQSAAFRHLFLRLFWHQATEEAWTGAEKLSWRSAQERPFDVPELGAGGPLQLAPANASLEPKGEKALYHSTSSSAPVTPFRRLWIKPNSGHHSELAKLAGKGTEIVWDDLGLPEVLVERDRGEILLPGSTHRLKVVLDQEQTVELTSLLKQQQTQWCFRLEQVLGDECLSNANLWLPGDKESRTRLPEQLISHDDIRAESLRMVTATSPASWKAPDPLALTVRYHWSALPPTLPDGSDEDQLVLNWRKVDQTFQNRIGELELALKRMGENQQSLAGGLGKWLANMLGFTSNRTQLNADLISLKSKTPSLCGPVDATKLLTSLDDVANRCQTLGADLEKAGKDAQLKKEEEEQRSIWEEKRSGEQKNLKDAQLNQEQDNTKLHRITAKLGDIQAKLADASESDAKDLKVEKDKLSDEETKLTKGLKDLRSQIDSLNKNLEQSFVFKPSAKSDFKGGKSAGHFIPEAVKTAPRLDLPKEALPSVGELRCVKKTQKRYLVIETWEQLDQGESDATRLKAELVARKN